MKIYSIEEVPVKSNPPGGDTLRQTFLEIDQMRWKLDELRRRLEDTGKRLFEHSDLCQGCEEFSSACLVVDHSVATLDGPQLTTETLCAACRREVA